MLRYIPRVESPGKSSAICTRNTICSKEIQNEPEAGYEVCIGLKPAANISVLVIRPSALIVRSQDVREGGVQ